MRDNNLNKLQQIELDILKQFIRICEQLHLRYFAIGGTLLGAVRHKGFIPWDDDIDVGMPRKDYEIFLRQAQALLPKPYFLQTRQTDPQYPLNFAKIRNSDTTFVENSMSNRTINHGVYIDIFPQDYYPDNFFSRIGFDIRWKLLHFRLRSEFIISEEDKAPFFKHLLQHIAMHIAKWFYPSAEKAIEAEEKLMRSTPYSSRIHSLCLAASKRDIMPTADYFDHLTTLPFEDLSICVPVNYQIYLKQLYGNYMKLPPENKRTPHHYMNTVDLEKSYTYYILPTENAVLK